MGQTYVGGQRVPVTKVQAGPCVVTQVKTEDKDGYWAVQLGFGERKIKNITKPMQGHLRAANSTARFLCEVRLTEEPKRVTGEAVKVGDQIKISDIFSMGDVVAVTGTSKGKGFAGVVKRWHFAGGPRTHGQSDRERAPGSIGQTTTPGRVYKGKKMAGRMGGERKTIKNLHVISLDLPNNELWLSGSVPGAVNSLLFIKKLSGEPQGETKNEQS